METTTITSTEHRSHTISIGRLALAVLLLGASAAHASAQVSIRGDRASVRLETNNAPISEVLSALDSAFSIRHRASVPLDQAISGTYRGSLRRVLTRLLDGYNYYVTDTANGGMEVTIVGRTGAATVAVADPRPAPPLLVVPPPTPAQVAAERQRLHHRRAP